MKVHDRELVLQKVVAISGFAFALLILPLAQYFLNSNKAALTADKGTVAGVSTVAPTTAADVKPQTVAECEAGKVQDLKDLQKFEDGKLIALERDYTATVKPYQDALPLDPSADGKAALQKLIDTETTKYNASRTQVVNAVNAQGTAISAKDCGSTTQVSQ